jgi:hypothetical protein
VSRIDHADAFPWLADQQPGPVVVSIPTATEVGMSPGDWDAWSTTAAEACLAVATNAEQPAVFIQTDRLADGEWHSWPAKIAGITGWTFIWHKIALTRPPDHTDLHRPTYRHVIAAGIGRPGRRTPDVWYDGHRRWENGTGNITAWKAALWLAEHSTGTILNPFAGSGTLIDAAEAEGRHAIGCDLDPQWARPQTCGHGDTSD